MKGTHPCADHGLASAAALTLASVPAVALAVPQDEASQNEASPITLDLYNLTDVHGHIQQVAKKGVVREAGLPAMNCYLKKARATYTVGSVTFLLAGGDSFEALTRGGAAMTNGNLDRDSFNAYLGAHSGTAARSIQATGGLTPREAKSSIGLTLPTDPVADGSTVTIPLRGLSFSEGPSITSKVRVSAGGAQAVADVNNSLVDAHASDAASVITTDGAGQASVDVTVVGACEGKAAGEVVNVPVTVATDFATVVEAGDGLTIPVTCAGTAAPDPSPSADAAGDSQSGNQAAPTPHKNTKSPKGSLARTGVDLGGLAGAMFVGAIGVAGVFARRRFNRYQSENK